MNNNSNTRLSTFEIRTTSVVGGANGAMGLDESLLLPQGSSGLANAAKRRSAVRCEQTTRIQKAAPNMATTVKGGSSNQERNNERRPSEEGIAQRGQEGSSFLRVISSENLCADNSSSNSSNLRREERGASFCDILNSSSSSSSQSAKNSLLMEEDGTSSVDASDECSGVSRGRISDGHLDDENDSDDDDLEQKIKFFFKRIEEQ